MKRELLLFVLLVVFPFVAQAQTSLSVNAKNRFLTAKGVVAYDGPVVQTDLFFNLSSVLHAFPKCLRGDIWWSKSADSVNFSESFGNEIDIAVDCAERVDALHMNMDSGLAIFHLTPIFGSKKTTTGDILQPYLDVSRDFHLLERHILAPYARAEAVLPVGWDHAKIGAFLYAGIAHQWTLHERITLNHRAALVYDTGALVNFDHGWMMRYDASIGWNITNFMRLDIPTVRLMSPVTIHDIRRTEYNIGVGITFVRK